MTGDDNRPIPLAPVPRWPWVRAFLLTSAMFWCGLVVGVVLTSAFLWKQAFDPFRQAPGFAVEGLMRSMQNELLLSDDQTKQLEGIFASHNERMKAIRDDVDPKIQAEIDSLKTQVEGVLSPEQAKRWNTRYDAMKQRFLNPPPPGRNRGAPPHGQMSPDLQGPPLHGAGQGDRPPDLPGMDGPPNGDPGSERPGPPPQGDGLRDRWHPGSSSRGGMPPEPPGMASGDTMGNEPPEPPPSGMERRPSDRSDDAARPEPPSKQDGAAPPEPPSKQDGDSPPQPPSKQDGNSPPQPPSKQDGNSPPQPPSKQDGNSPPEPPSKQDSSV